MAYNPVIWKPKQKPEIKKSIQKGISKSEELEEYEVQIGSCPLLKTRPPQGRLEPRTPPSLNPSTSDSEKSSLYAVFQTRISKLRAA